MDHECVDACARDRRRAARMARHLDHCILGTEQPARVFRKIHSALDRTGCPRARAELREQLQVCACLVKAAPGG